MSRQVKFIPNYSYIDLDIQESNSDNEDEQGPQPYYEDQQKPSSSASLPETSVIGQEFERSAETFNDDFQHSIRLKEAKVIRLPDIINDMCLDDKTGKLWNAYEQRWREYLHAKCGLINSSKYKTDTDRMTISEDLTAKTKRDYLRQMARHLGFAPEMSVINQRACASRFSAIPVRLDQEQLLTEDLSSTIRRTTFKDFVTLKLQGGNVQSANRCSTSYTSGQTMQMNQKPNKQNTYSRHIAHSSLNPEEEQQWEVLQQQWKDYVEARQILHYLAMKHQHHYSNLSSSQDVARTMWRRLVANEPQHIISSTSPLPEQNYLSPRSERNEWTEVNLRHNIQTNPDLPGSSIDESDWDTDDIDPVIIASVSRRDVSQPTQGAEQINDNGDSDTDWDYDIDLITSSSSTSNTASSPINRPPSAVPPSDTQSGGSYLWAEQCNTAIAENEALGERPGNTPDRPTVQPHEYLWSNQWNTMPNNHTERHATFASCPTHIIMNDEVTAAHSSPLARATPICSTLSSGALSSDSQKMVIPSAPEEPPPAYGELYPDITSVTDEPPLYTQVMAAEATRELHLEERQQVEHAIRQTENELIDEKQHISDVVFVSTIQADRLVARHVNKAIYLSSVWQKNNERKGCFIDENSKDTAEVGLGGISYDTKRDMYIVTLPDNIACIRVSKANKGRVKDRIKDKHDKKYKFTNLYGIDYSVHADLYVVTDLDQHCVMLVNPQTKKVINRFGSKGSDVHSGELNYPYYVKCYSSEYTDSIIVSNHKNNCISVFNMQGEVLQTLGENILQDPYGISALPGGILLVCDYGHRRVISFLVGRGDEESCVVLSPGQLQEGAPRTIAVHCSDDCCKLAVVTHTLTTESTYTLDGPVSPNKQELKIYDAPSNLLLNKRE